MAQQDHWSELHVSCRLGRIGRPRRSVLALDYIGPPVKLEYLKDGSDDCPLVRLYEFDRTDARRLRQTFAALADDAVERVGLDGVDSVDGTQLTFVRSTRDRGVTETVPHHFEVALTSEGWRQASELVDPFCDGGFGYQWLTPQTRGIQLLLSKDGAW